MVQSSFARATAAMTVLTGVSRLTGFVRIVVVAAVLGTTFLGNTYESANSVPNLLFELIAAGVLQAVLIPTLVSLLDRGDRTEAEHVAGSVLGLSCLILAALAVVGIAAAPLVARGLFAGVHDPHVRADEIRLGTVFLWFFLPQVVMYAVGMVATSRPQCPQPVRPSGVRPCPQQRRGHRVLRPVLAAPGRGERFAASDPS